MGGLGRFGTMTMPVRYADSTDARLNVSVPRQCITRRYAFQDHCLCFGTAIV